jgi:hypothetical protein
MQLAEVTEINGNLCRGVSREHKLYTVFLKKCFTRIQSVLGQHLKLIFAMYLDEHRPWGIHTDNYHVLPEAGERSLSMLIPLSVNNDAALVDQTHTIVFNEGSDVISSLEGNLPFGHVKQHNATVYHEQYLSHNPREHLEYLTVQNIYQWHRGDVIYWENSLFHDSDNFIANNFQSKQAIVAHTYK